MALVSVFEPVTLTGLVADMQKGGAGKRPSARTGSRFVSVYASHSDTSSTERQTVWRRVLTIV